MSTSKKTNSNPEPIEDTSTPTCFVMMPISDHSDYPQGHFNRVYEHLFQPAIQAAGFKAERADDITKTDYIVVNIVSKIIEADMVLCDLSSRNPNVLYELGLRHAYQKKVLLVKDLKTERIFDVQGLRNVEYDHSLRIDSVKKDILNITKFLKTTYEDNKEDSINSIVQLAGIKTAAPSPQKHEISTESAMILKAIDSLRETSLIRKPTKKYFTRNGPNSIRISDGTVEKGEEIFINAVSIGRLDAIHSSGEKCRVRESDGTLVEYSADDPDTQHWSIIPF